MQPKIMEERYGRFKESALTLFSTLHELAVEVGETHAKEAARDLVTSINEPFLFVVVGEVKAGKSSFINALLQDDVCEVAPDPCTDAIQKIVYSDEPYTREISQALREMGRPAPILRDIAIVDTPGTNTLIAHHQEVTEGFIPRADLVIFVFPAINPYTKTAWEFFDFVHRDWHKKIVFVLQQADRATDRELEINTRRVRELAGERGISEPRIFAVSAQESRVNPEAGGMEAIWRAIRETVTGGRHYLLKMHSLLETALHAHELLGTELSRQREALEQDRKEQALVLEYLALGEKGSLADLEAIVDRSLAAYDREAAAAVSEFEEGLGLFSLLSNSFKAVTGRKNNLKRWLEDINRRFEERFAKEMEIITNRAAGELASGMGKVVDGLLGQLERSASRVPPGVKSRDVAADRLAVVRQVTDNVFRLREKPAATGALSPDELRKLGDRTVVGGFITAVGAIIAASAHAVVFDVTGGLVTTAGAIIALNAIAFKRRGAIRAFRESFEQGRDRLEEELRERLAGEVETVYQDLKEAFEPLFSHVATQEKRVGELGGRHEAIGTDLRAELGRLDELETNDARTGTDGS
ncbi:GTP-binding protein HSR1 [Oceanidesulfovibrio indonesiensis]|uniref:GTP-binding protein HSR1 n=1 Tax=Oceanidesulfovibrio indonesiensis TaxID=54767 RepID=A0A7M3MD99_9BACT|nr:dynamin family protein [Oceanidesulfovibrio indonesiensis]TVM15979.1 GTP-binding protein HSR1 [Oceanidesulfovibrio indonesiensis]